MASNQLQEAQAKQNFRNDQAKGAAVHSFDPDATPEQKAATAGKARGQLKDIRPKDLDPAKGSSPVYRNLTRLHQSPPMPIARTRCRYRKLGRHPYDNRPRRRSSSGRCCHHRATCKDAWII